MVEKDIRRRCGAIGSEGSGRRRGSETWKRPTHSTRRIPHEGFPPCLLLAAPKAASSQAADSCRKPGLAIRQRKSQLRGENQKRRMVHYVLNVKLSGPGSPSLLRGTPTARKVCFPPSSLGHSPDEAIAMASPFFNRSNSRRPSGFRSVTNDGPTKVGRSAFATTL